MPGARALMVKAADVDEDTHTNVMMTGFYESMLKGTAVQPKIAIIGDKSSGKTSIFEGLTGLSFTRAERPMTNFAVHVKFQRTTGEKAKANAYIRPGPLDSQFKAAVKHLQSFEVTHDGPFLGDDFVKVLRQASDHMGITLGSDVPDDDEEVEEKQQLSDNILILEISGPDVHSLSVIDFPGLVHNSAPHETSELNAIRSLVMEYIQEPHSIILAVIDATNELSNQKSLELAQSVDPEGYRTVGVLSKCDMVQPGDESRVLKIYRNKVHHLDQGWFAVKNRSIQERRNGFGLDLGDASERAFFSCEEPWKTLSPGRTGLGSLKEFLGDTVNNMLQNNIDILLQKIQRMTTSTAGSRATNSVDLRGTIDYGQESLDALCTLSENTSQLDQSSSTEHDSDPDLEAGSIRRRPTVLINACTVALTVALVMTLIGLGCEQLAQEIATDGSCYRLFLLVTAPLQIFASLFFCQTLINTIIQLLGPVRQLRKNSKFYSANAGKRLSIKNGPLPHITIQCPVYKEGLEAVIEPTVTSLEAAIRHYESHGGTANIFINDDGMQLIPPEEAAKRRAFYVDHNVGWVARPKHNPSGKGLLRFNRRGKFKKASNMNYALGISLKVEDELINIPRSAVWTQNDEDEAYQRCLSEVLERERGQAWAEGNIRIGDYILLVDSDTRIPEECMIDAVSELEQYPEVAILQFSSGVMNVTTSYFETGITFFTNIIYTAIRFAVANGDVSPFVGHNAFLRWSALQEVSFEEEDNAYNDDEEQEEHHKKGLAFKEKSIQPTSSYEKFWSETHVSEDFDIALRLQTMGYQIRLGAYCGDEFKEGVSLTVYDELARWEKYAYGCNELLFYPVKHWWRHGPFTALFKRFIFSNMPIGSKITILSYIGTYYAIGYAWLGTLLNYFLIGWLNGHIDHYYINSWRVWVALVVVFSGAGNLALAIVRYRGEGYRLIPQLWTCFRWVPLLFIFLGGISLPVSKAIMSHMFSVKMSWGATSKEVTDTSFFIEMPMIIRRFKFVFAFCFAMTALMICGVYAFPHLWRINQLIAIAPLSFVVASHFFLPLLLNPALMKFTW